MKAKVILNPYANRWGARKQLVQLERMFDAYQMQFDLLITERPKQATQFAQEAAANGQADVVVAAGGDGTMNEVVNGLIRAAGEGPTMPLGILPIGTGNDFNDMNKLPRKLENAVQVITAGHTRQVDAGRVNDHYFTNNCALAMEPLITIENEKMKRLSGNIRYLAALIKGLMKLRAWDMQIRWEGGEYEGPVLLCSVCNGPRTGGVFMMSPDARFDDGLFDVVLAPDLSKLEILSILPRLFPGTHLNHPKVSFYRTRYLHARSNPGTPVHADGEVIAVEQEEINYQILPGKLTLLAPANTQPGTQIK